MVEKGPKEMSEDGWTECESLTSEKRYPKRQKVRLRSGFKEREAEREAEGDLSDAAAADGSVLAGTNSQLEEAEAVSALVDSAWVAAQNSMGDRKPDSQLFHRTVCKKVEAYLQAWPSGCKLGDLGPLLDDVLNLLESEEQCKLRPTAGKKSVFPLPAPDSSNKAGPWTPFLQGLVRGLNSMYGEKNFSVGNTTSRRVVKRLESVLQGSELMNEPIPNISFPEFFKHKGVDYQGEEIHVARRVQWKSIAPSLPEQVGTLDIREFL